MYVYMYTYMYICILYNVQVQVVYTVYVYTHTLYGSCGRVGPQVHIGSVHPERDFERWLSERRTGGADFWPELGTVRWIRWPLTGFMAHIL